jgi:hypothetical protein
MKIFKKKVKFVSKEEYDKAMDEITIIFNGMTVATNQQAQMLASVVHQLSTLISPKPQKKEKIEYDEAFQ